jgi:hydrogen cyanide synthase HcnC
VVVGGGVIGCAVAYFAARRGLDVTLVDTPKRGRATSASAGGLWPIGESVGLGCGVIFAKAMKERCDLDTTAHPERLPASFLDFALTSNAVFPSLAVDLRADTGMDVELERTSLLFLMYDDGDVAYAQGLWNDYPDQRKNFEWLSPEQVAAAEPALTRDVRDGALRFLGDDQLNPYAFADALRAGARARGARIVTHTEVTGVVRVGSRIVGVETAGGTVGCEVLVNAAGAWAGQVAAMAGIHVPVSPIRGQIVCTETLPKTLSACVSTTDCYLAQKKHGEIIIGSTTEDVGFDTGTTAAAIRTLSAGAVRAVPALAYATVKRVWSGLRPGTPDELPILGPVDGFTGYLNACGHFRTGILNAPLTGITIADLLTGGQPTYPIAPFLLSRFQTPDGVTSAADRAPAASGGRRA